MFATFVILLQDNLTLREVVQNIPHDGAAIFVYSLIALFLGFIWHGSRRRPS